MNCGDERFGDFMEYSSDLVKGSIIPVVLALLRERAMYGYEMVKQVNARSGGKLEWKEGTLYPTLHRLEAQGLIKSRWQEVKAGEGVRDRKYYAITAAG